MAEASWTSTVRCRYFARGVCRNGSSCRYLHDSSDINIPSTSSNEFSSIPCRYFQNGTCAYGSQCKYVHSIENGHKSDTSTSNGARTPVSQGSRSSGNIADTQSPASSTSCLIEETDIIETEPSTSTINKAMPLINNRKMMSSLKDQGKSADSGFGNEDVENWINAPEFIPSSFGNILESQLNQQPRTYADVLNAGLPKDENLKNLKLCPYSDSGICEMQETCQYLHGEICDLCGCPVIHPYNEDQKKEHISECIKQHEKDMEISFAIARSKDKTCGICFEIIMEKEGEKRFGILPNCNHCFCLSCIRKWRQETQFENKIIRACPECRVTSDFVCPSLYWVDTKEEKDKLIEDYKCALCVKPCKYFKMGVGRCPFGNKCFYLHAFPDGKKVDVGPPRSKRRSHNSDGEIDVLQQIFLWDFLEERENRWLFQFNDIDDLRAFFSDSDDSDWSDYELFFD